MSIGSLIDRTIFDRPPARTFYLWVISARNKLYEYLKKTIDKQRIDLLG